MLGLLMALALNPLQVSPPAVIQSSTGWCSPNIANVTGKVTITCIGVDPRALQALNAKLGRSKFESADRLRKANEWAARYKELERRLSESKDDSALSQKAERYLHEGRLKEAGQTLDRILASEEKVVDRTAANHYNRGLVSELQFQSLDAAKHFQLAYQYRPQNCEYGLEYGIVLHERGDYQAAEPVISSSVEVAKKLTQQDPSQRPCLSKLLNMLGLLYQTTGRSREAENAYSESLDGYYALGEAERVKYFPLMSAVLNNLAILYQETFRFGESESAFKNHLDIARSLAKIDPAYDSDVAETLVNLGALYARQNRFEEAEKELKGAISTNAGLASKNPGAYDSFMASAMINLGNVYDLTGRYAEAEGSYQYALSLCHKLARDDPYPYQHNVALATAGLANVYRDTQRLADAEKSYLVAVQTYQELVKISPGAYEPDLALTLGHFGKFYVVVARRLNKGIAIYQESLLIYERLLKANPARLQDRYAETLDGLGYAYMLMGDLQDARRVYDQALGIVRELSKLSPELFDRQVELHLRTLAGLNMKTQRNSEAKSEIEEAMAIGERRVASGESKAQDDLAKELIVATMVTDDCSLAAKATEVAVDEHLKEDSTTKFMICMMRHDPSITKQPMYFDPSKP